MPAPVATVAAVAASHVVCSYGGAGPMGMTEPMAHFVLIVDVEARTDVASLKLGGLRLRDAAGATIARLRASELAVAPKTRPITDLSTFDTTPFAGSLASGAAVRLFVHGTLDRPASAVMAANPTTYEAELVLTGDVRVALTGKVDPPWPTAGPAATH